MTRLFVYKRQYFLFSVHVLHNLCVYSSWVPDVLFMEVRDSLNLYSIVWYLYCRESV